MNGAGKPTGPVRGVQFKINLNELPTMACPGCKGQIFNTSVSLYKKLGATQSPSGKAQLVRVELACCLDCGAVSQVVGDELKPVELQPIGAEGPNET